MRKYDHCMSFSKDEARALVGRRIETMDGREFTIKGFSPRQGDILHWKMLVDGRHAYVCASKWLRRDCGWRCIGRVLDDISPLHLAAKRYRAIGGHNAG